MKMPAIGRLARIVLLRQSSYKWYPNDKRGRYTGYQDANPVACVSQEKPILWPACHRRSRTECSCVSPRSRSCGLRYTREYNREARTRRARGAQIGRASKNFARPLARHNRERHPARQGCAALTDVGVLIHASAVNCFGQQPGFIQPPAPPLPHEGVPHTHRRALFPECLILEGVVPSPPPLRRPLRLLLGILVDLVIVAPRTRLP